MFWAIPWSAILRECIRIHSLSNVPFRISALAKPCSLPCSLPCSVSQQNKSQPMDEQRAYRHAMNFLDARSSITFDAGVVMASACFLGVSVIHTLLASHSAAMLCWFQQTYGSVCIITSGRSLAGATNHQNHDDRNPHSGINAWFEHTMV